MNQFNNLPPEIIEFIFKKVNFKDLINLRIVDKRFKEICEQFRIKELDISNYFKSCFYTNHPIYLRTENLTKLSDFLNYRSIFRLDKYLRRLSIRLEKNFDISILNEFKLLEQLDMTICELYDNYKLNLANLKIANIQLGSYFKLTLNTNQLFAFKSSSHKLDQFIFKYAQKILFYETDYYDDQIKIFTNLQYLKLNNIDHLFNSQSLSKFEHLKTLDLGIGIVEQNDYNNLKEDINSIVEEMNLRKSDLQIYLNGVKLNNENQINQLKWSSYYKEFKYNLLEFQIKHYDLLKDNCSYMNRINYCDLIKLIEVIPSSFTSKFSYIQQIYANDHIDNEDQFIKFLNSISYLTELELENSGLTNSFYNKLINLVDLNELKQLTIDEKNELGLNFDFIFNLKQLILFDTNQLINNHIDQISKLFKENPNIQKIQFKDVTKTYVQVIRKYDDTKIDFIYLDRKSPIIFNF